ncbi:MAG: hypothetical protein IKO16_00465 [Lachnospiraceae bacterium]|nr:hypothetical protein [Lachnospiraceae bacterium]
MEVGFCSKCNNIDEYSGNPVCTKCGGKFLNLGVDISVWNSMDNNQMLDCIEAAVSKEVQSIKNVMKQPEPSIPSVTNAQRSNGSGTGASLVPGICPQCGGKLKVDKTKDAAVCEHCGTPFIVEKAINIVNNNIKLDSEDMDAIVDKIKDRDASLRDRVRKAHDFLNQYHKYDEQVVQKQQALKKYKASSYKSNGFMIGGAILGGFGLMMILSLSLLPVLLGLVFLGVGVFLVRTYIVKIKVEKVEKASSIASSEQEIDAIIRKTEKSYESIAEILPELPEDYYDEDTFTELDKIFTTNRADNMRQALSIIDERNHRRKMEEFERQNVELQKESNELQRQHLEVSKQNLETSRQNLKAQKRGNKISTANALVNTAHLASDVYKIFK